VLQRARAKAASRGAEVAFLQGFAGDVANLTGRGAADKAVSSLVFHQAPLAGKREGLAAISPTAHREAETAKAHRG